jgi:hypothetical protein
MKQAAIAVLFLLCCAATATAQALSGGRWEIGIYGGGIWTSIPAEGDATLPPPGVSFTTFSGNPSRRVPSWFFGDGTLLLNQLQATRPIVLGRSMVVPLDPLLMESPIRPEGGPTFGVRVGRALNDRFALEGSVEWGSGELAFTSPATAAIASTRESAERALREALLLQQSVSTTAEVREQGGDSITLLGTVKVRLFDWKSLAPFAIGGGGVVRHTGDAPSVHLQAIYAIRSPVGAPSVTLTETDTVNVEYSVAEYVPTGRLARASISLFHAVGCGESKRASSSVRTA